MSSYCVRLKRLTMNRKIFCTPCTNVNKTKKKYKWFSERNFPEPKDQHLLHTIKSGKNSMYTKFYVHLLDENLCSNCVHLHQQ